MLFSVGIALLLSLIISFLYNVSSQCKPDIGLVGGIIVYFLVFTTLGSIFINSLIGLYATFRRKRDKVTSLIASLLLSIGIVVITIFVCYWTIAILILGESFRRCYVF